jgi:shikimate dehydrogenase
VTSAAPFAEVIGDPITHSKSPAIHLFWLEKLGIGLITGRRRSNLRDWRRFSLAAAPIPTGLGAT